MKGFVFSAEAALSIGLILLIASTLWITTPQEINKNQITDTRIHNKEMMTLYFSETTTDTETQGNTNQKCIQLYYYDSNESKLYQTPIINEKTICAGVN